MNGIEPAAEFYYRSEGRERSWFSLSEKEKDRWRGRYRRAKERIRKELSKKRGILR